MAVAVALVLFAKIYGFIGLAIGAAFVLVGVDDVDRGAHGSYVFRLLLIPGMILLWPLVLLRWRKILRAQQAEAVRLAAESVDAVEETA
ncbi:MAG: hypothetical protein AAFV62_14415 [Pseudomonadota bacterium]